jgi:hypothetical protein
MARVFPFPGIDGGRAPQLPGLNWGTTMDGRLKINGGVPGSDAMAAVQRYPHS